MQTALEIKNTESVETKTTINTRKIRLFIDVPRDNKEELNKYFRRLYDWQKIAFKASNLISTHLFLQEQTKELFYFHDNVKLKLEDHKNDDDGMLNTSHMNSTYRVISQKFKNDLPSTIIASLNQNIYKSFIKEKSQYFQGTRSVRSYRSNIPIPFEGETIFNLRYDNEIKNFRFSLFNSDKYRIPFRTYLGRDASGNKKIIERCISNEYKICSSSIKIDNGEIFLYLTTRIPTKQNKLSNLITAQATLSFLAPAIITIFDKEYYIGDKTSYLHKRIAIQQSLKRKQQLTKYNTGGRGRKQKTHGFEEFKLKEKNFIDLFTHKISHDLVKICIENRAGLLELSNITQTIDESKENPFVIRNWSYGNLLTKIEYKCKKTGIKLIKT